MRRVHWLKPRDGETVETLCTRLGAAGDGPDGYDVYWVHGFRAPYLATDNPAFVTCRVCLRRLPCN